MLSIWRPKNSQQNFRELFNELVVTDIDQNIFWKCFEINNFTYVLHEFDCTFFSLSKLCACKICKKWLYKAFEVL